MLSRQLLAIAAVFGAVLFYDRAIAAAKTAAISSTPLGAGLFLGFNLGRLIRGNDDKP